MYHSLFQPIVAYLCLLGPIAEFTTQIYAKTSNNTPELNGAWPIERAKHRAQGVDPAVFKRSAMLLHVLLYIWLSNYAIGRYRQR